MDKSELEAELAEWKVNDKRPNLSLRTKAKLLAHAARVFIGVDYTVEAQRAYDADLELHERKLALIAAAPSPQPRQSEAAPGPAVPAGR